MQMVTQAVCKTVTLETLQVQILLYQLVYITIQLKIFLIELKPSNWSKFSKFKYSSHDMESS